MSEPTPVRAKPVNLTSNSSTALPEKKPVKEDVKSFDPADSFVLNINRTYQYRHNFPKSDKGQ